MYDNQLVKRVVELTEENRQLQFQLDELEAINCAYITNELNDAYCEIEELEAKIDAAQEDIAAMLKTFGYNLFVCKYCKHSDRKICDNCDDAEWRYKDD